MRLGVNIDHVATVREARKADVPDPVAAAILVELAGADGIVCHLREDRRHIKDRDVFLLKEVLKTNLNLEMAATDEMVKIAIELKPQIVTLVPEKREELTTEGGLEVAANQEHLRGVIETLRNNNIPVSLFIAPDIAQIKASARIDADAVELHTGPYSHAIETSVINDELEKIRSAAVAAHKLGMGVCAGHGLNYQNVKEIVAISHIQELNIGHSIVSRAVLEGMDKAVREMVGLLKR